MATGNIMKSGVTIKKLWSNPNPNSSFPAQTVSLDLNGYDFFGVVLCFNVSLANKEWVLTQWFPCNSTPYDFLAYIWGFNGHNGGRAITFSNTGLAFSNGELGGSGNNNAAVPMEIYGIKGLS